MSSEYKTQQRTLWIMNTHTLTKNTEIINFFASGISILAIWHKTIYSCLQNDCIHPKHQSTNNNEDVWYL
jgi:hypothetical protein